jgi:hypothetical protein
LQCTSTFYFKLLISLVLNINSDNFWPFQKNLRSILSFGLYKEF